MMSSKPDISPIEERLQDKDTLYDPGERKKAEEILSQVADKRAIPYLIDALRDEHGVLMVDIERVLASFGSAAVPDLVTAMHDDDRHIRRCATYTLGWIDDPHAIDALFDALDHEDAMVRKDAVDQLGNIATQPRGKALRSRIVPRLVDALSDDALNVRSWAVRSLGMLREVPAIIDALRDDASVRAQALEVLSSIGDIRAVPDIIKVLQYPDLSARMRAAHALGNIGDESAVPALIAAIQDKDNTAAVPWRGRRERRVCDVAAGALAKIGTPVALAAIEDWRAT
jgi:HEAT repeat protein